MIVSDEYKYIFLHVPKNAGTSIKEVLKEKHMGIQHGVHTSAVKAQRLLGKIQFDDYFKFAVVRNPYSRVVSWYNHLLRESESGLKKENIIKPLSFKSYVLNQTQIYKHKDLQEIGLWQTQFDFLSIDGELMVNRLMRYEHLDTEFVICFDDVLPHLKNWGVGDDYMRFYDDELKEIVYDRFKIDFEVFRYDK